MTDERPGSIASADVARHVRDGDGQRWGRCVGVTYYPDVADLTERKERPAASLTLLRLVGR
jgi:hypothetical protein